MRQGTITPRSKRGPAALGPAALGPAALGMAVWLVAAVTATVTVTVTAQEVSLKTLLREAWDLEHLTRWPEPAYRTVQFSSYDRRSVAPDRPEWFSNADGFGHEPVPGFERVLKEPGPDHVGRYLVCDVKGPGALVRGWTAGMDGTFKVYLDGGEKPLYQGPADDFLRRRLKHFSGPLGEDFDPGHAFQQEDADYFPIPFARGLRIEHEGDLNKLHFYQIGVRLYDKEARVVTFQAEDLPGLRPALEEAVMHLNHPPAVEPGPESTRLALDFTLPAGARRTRDYTARVPGAIRQLALRARADDLKTALRATLLRIRFDGASVPQVEAPLGDFFGAAPGVNPFASLPVDVKPDSTMICRFVMPFQSRVAFELVNTGPVPVQVQGEAVISPYVWDKKRSLYFRARWRVSHGLLAGNEPEQVLDMPFLIALGTGRYVGSALSVVNPSPVPTAWGNWWGEGDEKVFVDGEARPSTFGTGTEDYFNYSWSRSHLFSYPYTVQPLVSGPDHRGYVTNIRWHVLDDLPFQTSLEFLIELWHHTPTPGLSYARIGYHYGRPGLRDDHPPLARADLVVPELEAWTPLARLGTHGATFFQAEAHWVRADGDQAVVESPHYAEGRAVRWQPGKAGARLRLDFTVSKPGEYTPALVFGCSPAGSRFKAFLDDQPLTDRSGQPIIVDLATAHNPRLRYFTFQKTAFEKGVHTLALEAVSDPPGELVWDFFWLKP